MSGINPIKIHHKGNPGFGLLVAIIVLILASAISYLTFYFSRDFLVSTNVIAQKMPYIFTGLFFFGGVFTAIIFIRQEFEEVISIDSKEVRYIKSGRLRKTIIWTEPTDRYNALEENEEEVGEEDRSLTLKLKHSRNPEKDIVLVKNLADGKERMEKRAYYKKLLKLE